VTTSGGTTTLLGANSYTGVTIINGGTLLGGAANAFSAISGTTVHTGGTLDLGGLAQSIDTVDLSGGTIQNGALASTNGIASTGGTIAALGGSTGVTVNGGTTTLLGVNSYTGGSTINVGTLAVGAGGSLSTTGFVNLAGSGAVFDISEAGGNQTIGALSGVSGSDVNIGANSLTFGDASNTVFGGGFSGTGSLIKQGGGVFTLTGDASAFAGTTTIDAGTLEVGDAADPGAVLGGNVDVANAGTLRGHGTIDGNVVNDGVVSPGGSIGRLTVDGNYTQKSDGTLNIEVTPLTVAGTGYDQLVIHGSASLAGRLAVEPDSGTYSVGSVYDILHAAGGVSGSFATVTYNPAFAAYLTPDVNYSPDDVFLELTPSSLAFSSGRIYVANTFVQDSAVLDVMSAPFGGSAVSAADDTDRGYWLHGLGSFGQANGYDINEKGFVIGKGFDVSPNLVLGGAISNVYTATTGDSSSVTGSSFGALLYGIYNLDRFRVSASTGVGHLSADISRGLPTLGETAQGASNGTYEAAALRVQYNLLSSATVSVTPYASASYLHTLLGSAQENGAGILNLRYDATSSSLAELGAGVTASTDMPIRYGLLTPWVQLGWTGTLGNPHVHNTEVLGTFTAGETALAAPVDAFTPAVGVELTSNGPWHLAAAWGGQFGSAASVETFTLSGSYHW
jgi:autotransporter-associated beta strand protein